jgi:hypothetical protein
MNTQPLRNVSLLGYSWSSLRRLAIGAGILAGITVLNGCGGSADQIIATTTPNTPLIVANFSGLKGYTLGSAQVYSLTVKDPDGIASVSVTLDGVNVPVTNAGDIYSITVPASFPVGTHSVIFSARGKSSDGTLEVPISEGLNFTIFVSNTPLFVSAVQGFAAYTLGTAQTYFADLVDPDGITSVTATLNGQPISVTNAASRYSVVIPANTPAGNNTLRFEGVGKQPNAADEAAKSAQLAFVIYPNNTPLVTGSVAGLTSYTVGGSQTYSLSPVDPDGITAVTATLDGGAVSLVAAGNTYSFSTPTNLAVGNHAVSFTASGKQPNGAAETTITVSQNFTILTTNTPLNISAITGATSYTVGNTQQYTVTVNDPDGGIAVSATLDGNQIAVVPSGSNYSITLPVTVAAGVHTIQFSATGRRPDGSTETAQTVTQQIQVLPVNTTLSLGTISGLSAYVTGATPTYTTNIVDPDGVGAVSATLDGQTIGVSNNSGAYSVTVPSSLALGSHTIVFTARGTLPGGGQETAQTRSITFTVLAQNTALTISAITGPATIPLGTIGTYSTTVVDPDAVSSVNATIDNVSANVTRNGSIYSVQTPAYTTGGAHVVTFTAIGQIPGGGTEPAQSVSLGFNAQTANTAITVGAINGPAQSTVGQSPQYTFDVVDPDGIIRVTATLDGQSIAVSAPNIGSTYSVQIPANATPNTYTLVVTAVGVIPGGTEETAQTQPFNFTVLASNTTLTMSQITLQTIRTTNGLFDQWSITIVEPDGTPNITALANGQSQVFFKNGDVYSFSTPVNPTISTPTITYTATGVEPNGRAEAQQTRTYSAPPPN